VEIDRSPAMKLPNQVRYSHFGSQRQPEVNFSPPLRNQIFAKKSTPPPVINVIRGIMTSSVKRSAKGRTDQGTPTANQARCRA
jgi:hypothetical protein